MGFSLGGFVSDIFGSKNKTQATAPKVDANAYQYGGAPGGADAAANQYALTGAAAQQRQGAQANYGQADQAYGQSQQAYGQSQQARQGQASLASRMDARASGAVPSIAGMQAQQDMQRAQAAQASMAGSARGPAAMALAQQQAANNTANAQSQISGQAQVNAANERLSAEQNASAAYGNLRGSDLASQGNLQADQRQLAQQSQFNAQLGQNQHALNDQMQLGMTQAEMGVRNSQLQAGINQQAQQSGNALGATGINAGVGGQNAAMNQQNGMMLVGAGQKAAGAAAGLARGGPAKVGAPYIVGEQGPELIVPRQNSVVIPNHVAFPPGTPTWGTGTKPAAAPTDLNRPYNYEERDARLSATGGMAVPGFSPGTHTTTDQPLRQMDQDTLSRVRAQQAEGLDISDKDQHAADSASYRERQARGNDAKAEAAPKKATLASRLQSSGDDTMRDASRIDVGYHGPAASYAPMQLIPIGGARAMGGPVDGGVPYMVGEQGPEALVPTSGPGAPGSVQVPGVSAPTIASGGPQTAVQSWQGAAKERNNAAFGLMGYSAGQADAMRNPSGKINRFEDGGEAKGGQPAIVGERGPEYVVEQPKEPTWADSPLARSLASGKSREGAAALPLSEGSGKYLQQSPEGHAYLATAPSEDDGRPSLASRMKSPAPAAGATPPPPPVPKAKPRAMTPDEMMAAANAMGAQQQSEHEARMAAGPAVRMPVELGTTPQGQPVAQVKPEQAIAFRAQRPFEMPEGMPDSPTALPPPRHPPIALAKGDGSVQWPGTDYRVVPKDLPYTMSARGGLARAMRKR